MPVPRSEVQSIIAQIRAGNNDPELIATALEAIVDNTPYSGRGYKELLFSFGSNGDDEILNLTIINNTLGLEIASAEIQPGGVFYFEIYGAGFSGVSGPLWDVYAFIPSDEGAVASYYMDGGELYVRNTLQTAYFAPSAPAIVRIRRYDNQ